jgi:hypothetical protein
MRIRTTGVLGAADPESVGIQDKITAVARWLQVTRQLCQVAFDVFRRSRLRQ